MFVLELFSGHYLVGLCDSCFLSMVDITCTGSGYILLLCKLVSLEAALSINLASSLSFVFQVDGGVISWMSLLGCKSVTGSIISAHHFLASKLAARFVTQLFLDVVLFFGAPTESLSQCLHCCFVGKKVGQATALLF